ncbi:S1/P1 nuclease [Sinomicrobium soli]|uniref:S1/P1 nuclease n=1 Tax=Sinomicrobium sp. N-1-3-6 TaxID=2219864 RepID=UPI000DCC2600|nr:S1/P1 nuclease [Sinomicrobium sp. N-1-3-6]RAV27503.1 S1/P1 Nuclease [Sinomicrobium sp. N-1-3-6]
MKKAFFLLLIVSGPLLWAAEGTSDWGPTGHRTVAEIAEKYLSRKAGKKISSLLHGEKLAVGAAYADEIKSDPRYRYINPWHYVNIAPGKHYGEAPANPQGDLVTAIEKCAEVLRDDNATEEDKVFYLKLLVHFIGDLHQPLHVGRAEDKGGNDIQVRWFNEGTNLHSVWDSRMIDHYKMSYTELADSYPDISRDDLRAISGGTVGEWVEESRLLADRVYASAGMGDKLGYKYMYDHFDTVREQLRKGGIRLAAVLNDIFG